MYVTDGDLSLTEHFAQRQYVYPLSLIHIYTRSEYEQIRQSGFDYQPLLWRTHILTDCPDDDANYEKDENAGTGVAAKRLSKFTLFPRLWR